MNKEELFNRLVCALTHNLQTCHECKKCGLDTAECRLQLIEELAKLLDVEVPWKENEKE